MRYLLFILIFAPLGMLAQSDSLRLVFGVAETKLNRTQIAQLSKLIGKGRILKVDIIGYIGGENLSKNRINVDYRLIEAQNTCLQNGAEKNQVSIKRAFTDNELQYNTLVISASFIPEKKGDVVFKTDRVEISEYELPKSEPVKLVKKEVVIEKPKPKPKPKKKAVKKTSKKDFGQFELKEFKKNEVIVIRDLLFVATRSTIEKSSVPILKDLLYVLKAKPSLKIQLRGHICCRKDGGDVLDWRTNTPNLSENRAKMVCIYLVRNGISPSRLSYVGLGSKYKLADDRHDFDARAKNRRVEIFVVEE